METKVFNPLLNETFLIRPYDNFTGTIVQPYDYVHPKEILRYSGGKWLPDDGQPDLAFVQGVLYWGVEMPNDPNLIWSWNDLELTKSYLPKHLHKHAKGGHYCTVNNSPLDDQNTWDKSKHPNEIAWQSAQRKSVSFNGCANGISAEIFTESPYDKIRWISNGLILVQSTMKPLTKPENPTCYLCMDNGKGHLIETLKRYKEDLEEEIEETQKELDKAQDTVNDCEWEIGKMQKELPQVIEELAKLGVEIPKEVAP